MKTGLLAGLVMWWHVYLCTYTLLLDGFLLYNRVKSPNIWLGYPSKIAIPMKLSYCQFCIYTQVSYCKSCIYTHPVNYSKSTIWQNYFLILPEEKSVAGCTFLNSYSTIAQLKSPNILLRHPSKLAIPRTTVTHHSHFAGGKCGQQSVPQESPVIPVRV